MPKISIVESVGGDIQTVTNYRDLENHHPSKALKERGRVYARVGGENEEILGDYAGTAVLTPGGNYMVSKDMVLKAPGLANDQVPIPSPASGVIGKIDRADGIITINDPKTGDTMFQIRHAKIDPNLKPGDSVQYGQPLGLQHGYNKGDPNAFGDHVHFDVNTKYIAQADRWIKDMHNGTITTDKRPQNPGENIVTAPPTFVPISGNFPKPADPPLADGKLSPGEYGPEVEKLQKALNAAGARDAKGNALNPDKDYGDRTQEAVEDYQRKHNMKVTGVADDKMLRQLGVIGQEQTVSPQPQPQLRTPSPQQTEPPPARPAQPTTGAKLSGGPTDFGPNNALGALISSGEGNYNSFNRGRAGDAGGKEIDFSKMTVAEVMRRQDLPSGNPDRLFAVGKYQVIPGTMEEAVKALKIDPNQKFTPQLQERIFADYLIDEKRPAVRDYITGKTGPEGLGKAQLALAQEFASVADPRTGKSYYDGDSAGNSASISAKQVGDALNQMRGQYQQNIKSGLSPSEAYRALSGDPGGPMVSGASKNCKKR
jgi:peptidoglycan hydrolase-like protein with peptidoglycan-binding domain